MMHRLQDFQIAAHEYGFVEVNETGNGTVLWLRRITAIEATRRHQRMCIDGITNSVTIFWITAPERLNSKTFRDVPELREWLVHNPELALQR